MDLFIMINILIKAITIWLKGEYMYYKFDIEINK